MIQFLNVLQLVLYIGGLALVGQAILYAIVGNKRETNMFYQLFVVLNKPWTAIAKLISPKNGCRATYSSGGFLCCFSFVYRSDSGKN